MILLLVQDLGLSDKLLNYGLPGFTIMLVAGFLWHMQQERKAADARTDRIQDVFLAHNAGIAKQCEERTTELVSQVVESNERHESALRDLALEIRNTRLTKPA